ncbi:DUF2768 family protein [Marinicrinis lubricantis]|uniref:DUF2768 family protein n=1 Tax=Marinicrinis lubricantis TaxID=2086470 RepID=A0ABW1IM32_9BACL
MDAMDKMWLSLIAIILMVVASVLITVARTKTKGWIRRILSLVAFIVLFYAVVLGFISIV